MSWWFWPIVIGAPLAVFAAAWGFGRMGDWSVQSRERALRVQIGVLLIMTIAFATQAINHWLEHSAAGLGFWVSLLGATAAAAGAVVNLRQLRTTARAAEE